MKTRLILLFLIISTLLFSVNKPNIIILFADDLGYGDLGCYGHPTIRTPHLNTMAEEGLRLTSFYVAASVCSPSRAALLTGKNPSNVGITRVFNNKSENGLALSEITIAEGLKTVGYSTAIIGKWHLGHQAEYLPLNQGFDYWFGVPYSNDNNGISSLGNKNLSGPPLPLYENHKIIEHGVSMETITKRYTAKAIEFIEAEKNNPFFIYLPYTMPHVPIDASEKFKGKSAAGLYGDVIEELDWSVGQILQTLEKLGLEENTLVVFTSDNGPMIHIERPGYNAKYIKNWHHGTAGLFRGGKFDVYEGGFRVPAIFQWKGKIEPNRVSSEIIKSIDLLPSLFRMVGINQFQADDLDGKDITGFLLKGEKSPHSFMVYEHGGKKLAYREGDWKIVFNKAKGKKSEIELFNIKDDVSEQYNLAEQKPQIVQRLIKYINIDSNK